MDRGIKDLVYINQYGLLGTNYYWSKHLRYGITKKEIISTGLKSDRVVVHKDIIDSLILVDNKLQEKGFRLFIKEGYRSKKLYRLIYKKRILKFGQNTTNRLLNIKKMPHSSGKSVDAVLWSVKDNKEILMRDKEEDPESLFYGYYNNKNGEKEKRFQELQFYLANIMQNQGFRFGEKREYFHFDYRPDLKQNL